MVTTQLYIFHDFMTNLCKLKSPWLKISVQVLYILSTWISSCHRKLNMCQNCLFITFSPTCPFLPTFKGPLVQWLQTCTEENSGLGAMLTESGPKWEREVHSYMQRKRQPLPLWRWQFVEEMMSGMECLKKQYTIEHGFWKKYPTSCLSLLLKAPFISIVCLFVFRENG